jgi:predicted nucleotidyltransferase
MLTLEDIATKYQLDLILLFGSRATGDVHAESDVDIAVYGKEIFSETAKIQLMYELCGVFHTDNLDLVDLRTAPVLLKKEIFENYRILFQKDSILLCQLELANMHELKELEILDQIRRERLKEFVR